MRRPQTWRFWLLLACLAIVIGESVALLWIAPHYLVRVVEQAAGGQFFIGKARLSFPLAIRLAELRFVNSTSDAALTAQRVIIRPSWASWSSKTIWLDTVEIEQPLLRLTRASDGTMRWPSVSAPSPSSQTTQPNAGWRLRIGSIKVVDGTLEVVDQRPPQPFHGLLDHIHVTLGPVSLPVVSSQTTFAFRSQLVGDAGHAAPLYCSGWTDFAANDLQAYCQLEPLALGAFEPYYQGRLKVRVYNATLKSTSIWLAKSNELEGRVQVELGNLSEGDLSVRGATVVDVKRLTAGGEPHLRAELKLVGPLNNPADWRPDFVPGNALVQQLVKPLLDRGIEMVRIPFGGRTIGVSLSPASPAMMSDIEAAAKQVQDELQILATPTEEAAPTASSEPAPAPASAATAPPSPPAAPPTPESAASQASSPATSEPSPPAPP